MEITCCFSVMDLVHLCSAKMTLSQRQRLDLALKSAEVPATPAKLVVNGILSGNPDGIIQHHILQLVNMTMTRDDLLEFWDFSATMTQVESVRRVRETCHSSLAKLLPEPSWLQAKMNERGRSESLRKGIDEILKANFFHCPICLNWVHTHLIRSCTSSTCKHSWCQTCVLNWASQPNQVAIMASNRRLQLPCLNMAVGCTGHVPEEVLWQAETAQLGSCKCSSRRTCGCPPLVKLLADLRLRAVLQARAHGRRCCDCPDPFCVGVAYSGAATYMCFLCENQWSVPSCGGLWLQNARDALRLGSGSSPPLKQCPQCGVPIEKTGGCDHMTCVCGHEFNWSRARACRMH